MQVYIVDDYLSIADCIHWPAIFLWGKFLRFKIHVFSIRTFLLVVKNIFKKEVIKPCDPKSSGSLGIGN